MEGYIYKIKIKCPKKNLVLFLPFLVIRSDPSNLEDQIIFPKKSMEKKVSKNGKLITLVLIELFVMDKTIHSTPF